MYRESKFDTIVYNGKVVSKNDSLLTGIEDHPIVYEVIRLINGVPLFFNEHIDRMNRSADMMGFKMCCNEALLREEIAMLVDVTGELNHNIKLLYTEFDGKTESCAYFIPSFYPDPKVYVSGVNTVVYHSERDNPNAKVLNRSLKERIERIRHETGSYEAILVNKRHQVTEGSRSNIFFVKDNHIITARSNDVLEGITRQQIILMMKNQGIPLIEKEILEAELETFDGAFITGTSINILPVKAIDKKQLNSGQHPLIIKMMTSLDNVINTYIKENINA